MSSYIEDRVAQLTAGGYDFKFGDYISKGFSLFSRQAVGYILFTLVFFILFSILGGVVFAVSFIPGSQLLMGLVTSIAYCIFKVGCYNVAHKGETGQSYQFQDFFRGFQDFNKIIIPALLLGLISSIPNIPNLFGPNVFDIYRQMLADPENAMEYLQTMSESANPMLSMLSSILWIPVAILLAMWHWTIPLVVFHNMDYSTAMNISKQVISKNLILITVFLIIVYLIGWLGMVLCCVGIFATLPAMMNAQYAAFADVIGFQSGEQPDDVIEHLVS